MKKKIFFVLLVSFFGLAALPPLAAFEAHILNVSAAIENALSVPVEDITFGLVFPQEELDAVFDVSLSESFMEEDRVDDVEYMIRQKPKCWNGDPQLPEFGRVTENEAGEFICVDEGYEMLPLLCPYLSKHELTADGTEIENDAGLNAFHGLPGPWTPSTTVATEVYGRLVKSGGDTVDSWNVDLKVPCFGLPGVFPGGNCAQDWESYVLGINPNATPADYIAPAENMGLLYGCDLWLEVRGISLPLDCEGVLDLMLVLDRSVSIDGVELAQLKSAANQLLSTLAPTTTGVYVGQTSFATTGSLDLHLTPDETSAHAAVNALVAGGLTNLKEGLELATAELDDGHEHERASVDDAILVITDGNPTRPAGNATSSAAAAADTARAAGISVLVVGVGVSSSTEAYLKTEIADDAAHYYNVANFAALDELFMELPFCPAD
jgi:uncharacterized protein YegL